MASKVGNNYVGRTGIAAFLVATGILLSRIAGLVRERVFAHFFGNTAEADAFRAALRIPNFLQNLFGEGVLSASFIPVYSQMLQRRQFDLARTLANATAGILGLLVSGLVLLGLVTAPILTDLLAPGFTGQKRDLTITLVRILFPGTGILVLSALCLGILNSHGRFFVSYAAPVLWNLAIIAILVYLGPHTELPRLAMYTAWAAVLGSILQIAIQLPQTIRLAGLYRPSLGLHVVGIRQVLMNAIPVTISRGIVQVSGYIDSIIASFLPTGAVSALGYAQTLYLLPVSLFGMSISAAELPVLSRAAGQTEQADQVRTRLEAGLRRIMLLIAPSVTGFIALGDVVVGAIYRSGRFGPDDTMYVWAILAVASLGLPASTLSRLYCAAFYARKDTRTPLYFALVRVFTSTCLAIVLAIYLPRTLGLPARWGILGIVAGSASAGVIEYSLLRSRLISTTGHLGPGMRFLISTWSASIISACIAALLKTQIHYHPILLAALILPLYGLMYLALALLFGIDEARQLISTLYARRGSG